MGMRGADKHDLKLLARVNRIEGQVRDVAHMVAGARYCIDIFGQIQAIKAAIKREEKESLKVHAAHCVTDAIRSGNAKDQLKIVTEFVESLGRYGKCRHGK